MEADERLVFVDANILINLAHIDRLDLLHELPYRFVVPAQVGAEILRTEQRLKLDSALAAGWLREDDIREIEILVSYAELKRTVGDGEAACLALAEGRGGLIATSDKKRKFMREVEARIGRARILNLAGLLVASIRRGVITIETADRYKAILASHRFVMDFGSFAEKV